MAYQLCVITKIRNPATNFACDVAWAIKDQEAAPRSTRATPGEELLVMTQVFTPGEILLVDEFREVGYPGRDPDKWEVEYQRFALDQVEAAVALARTVLESEFTRRWVEAGNGGSMMEGSE
jgi:hypothetical protein